MMLVPARKNDFFADFLSDPFDVFGGRPQAKQAMPAMMKTDILETEKAYEFDIDLPGFKKENVHAELQDGYLTIQASIESEAQEKGENGTYLRKERFTGSCRRSFYVGEDISEDDIRAKFEDGILRIVVPKKELPAPEDAKRLISIEG
ncbi:heat-shock protein Hsp20 [Slackia faecicanis]|uniref:Heat-shock protein Hsp20 n=1 Tax=Slackia faecicanis TaxID=255723 RepID=A0A3N0AGD7_9ACTN|nr:Hsp20/alpha crystallin family protein [Slackia faecicanis]RNL20868.1 heat-shock protein Hsp20 [Slackia faecicanis]